MQIKLQLTFAALMKYKIFKIINVLCVFFQKWILRWKRKKLNLLKKQDLTFERDKDSRTLLIIQSERILIQKYRHPSGNNVGTATFSMQMKTFSGPDRIWHGAWTQKQVFLQRNETKSRALAVPLRSIRHKAVELALQSGVWQYHVTRSHVTLAAKLQHSFFP